MSIEPGSFTIEDFAMQIRKRKEVALSIHEEFARGTQSAIRRLITKGLIPADSIFQDTVRKYNRREDQDIGGGIILTARTGGFLVEEPRWRPIPGKKDWFETLLSFYHLRQKWAW